MLLQTQQRLARRAGHSGPAAPRTHHHHQQQQQRRGRAALAVRASVVPPGSTVLVAGATGGVGQLVTAKLLDRGYRVVALCRNKERARQLLGGLGGAPPLEFVEADARDRASLARAFAEIGRDVDAVVCTTGTTAFPSDRWNGNNGPRPTDLDGNLNMINACPRAPLKRFLLVTSAGVERQAQFPWLVLNLYGVLSFKRAAELALEESGLPFTILRPSRLVDGPYTSKDLNTLLKATSEAQGLTGVAVALGDALGKSQASRVAVAEACVQALQSEAAEGRAFCIESCAAGGGGGVAADGGRVAAVADAPAGDRDAWEGLFRKAAAAASS